MSASDDKQASLEGTAGQPHDFKPPPYPGSSQWDDSVIIPEAIPHLKPSSFFRVVMGNGESITESYLVDRLLEISPSLKKFSFVDAKGNVYLSTTSGDINADIWILDSRQAVGGDIPREDKQVVIEARTGSGTITMNIHATPATPFKLTCTANGGGPIEVCLPRSYSGLFFADTLGSVQFSPEVKQQVTRVNLFSTGASGYIGARTSEGKAETDGNEVHLSSKGGTIRLSYVHEERITDSKDAVSRGQEEYRAESSKRYMSRTKGT